MDWKGIVEKIVITVIAGGILGIGGYFANQALSPAMQPIEARMSWVQVDNPIPTVSAQSRLEEETEKALEKAFGISGLARFTQRIARNSLIGVARIEFMNSSDVRSKEVEVSLPSGLLYSEAATDRSSQVRSELKLKSIEPHSKVEVLAVIGTASYRFLSPFSGLKAFHNERQVQVLSMTLSDDLLPLGGLAANYPVGLTVLVGIGALSIVVLVGGILVALVTRLNVKWMARITDNNQLRSYAQILAYVQKNDPERWEKVKALKPPYPSRDEG